MGICSFEEKGPNISWTYLRAAFDKINDKITKRCPEKIYCARKLDIPRERDYFSLLPLSLSPFLSSLFSRCICVGYTTLIIKNIRSFYRVLYICFYLWFLMDDFFVRPLYFIFGGNRCKMTKIRDKCLSKIRDRVSFFIIDVPILVKFADRDRTLSRLIVQYIHIHRYCVKIIFPVLFHNI